MWNDSMVDWIAIPNGIPSVREVNNTPSHDFVGQYPCDIVGSMVTKPSGCCSILESLYSTPRSKKRTANLGLQNHSKDDAVGELDDGDSKRRAPYFDWTKDERILHVVFNKIVASKNKVFHQVRKFDSRGGTMECGFALVGRNPFWYLLCSSAV